MCLSRAGLINQSTLLLQLGDYMLMRVTLVGSRMGVVIDRHKPGRVRRVVRKGHLHRRRCLRCAKN